MDLFNSFERYERPELKTDYRGLLNLSSNELHHPAAAGRIIAALSRYRVVTAYPYYPETADAVAKTSGLPPASCILTPGSDAAIRLVMETFRRCCRHLIIHWPAYDAYELYAHQAGIETVRLAQTATPSEEYCGRLLETAFEHAGNAMVVLVNPDGFTGRMVPLATVVALARDLRKANAVLVVDEAYASFAPIDHSTLIRQGADNVVIIRSYSKSLGLASFRIAATFAAVPLINAMYHLRPTNPVSGVAMHILRELLEQDEETKAILSDVRYRRELLATLITSHLPCSSAYASAANFVLFELSAHATRRKLLDSLAAKGIVIKDLSAFGGFETCVRITVPDQAGCQLLEAILSTFGKHRA